MHEVHTPSKRLLVSAWLVALLPVTIFFGLLAKYVTYLPVEDDYDALLGVAISWTHTHGWQRVLLYLTNQHNEYKPFLQNALLGLQLGTVHHVVLWPWIWVGNILVLACLLPFWRRCAPGRPLFQRFVLFLPVIWILINLNYAETLNFALSDMQEIPVLLFSLLAIEFATRKDLKANYWSCVFVFLACLAYANAFLLAPMALAFFRKRGKRHVIFLWWLAVLAVLLPFLYHYQAIGHQKAHLYQYLLFTLTMAGAGITYFRFLPHVIPVLLGIAVCGVVAWATWKRVDRRQPFAYWAAVLMLGSCALAAYGRAFGGIHYAFAPRYRIYSDTAVAACYLLLLSARVTLPSWADLRKPFRYALAFAVFYGLLSDAVGFRLLQTRRRALVYGMQHYVTSGGQESPLISPDYPVDTEDRRQSASRSRDTLTEAVREGLYQIPARY